MKFEALRNNAKDEKNSCEPVENPDLIGTLHHYSGVPSVFCNARDVEVWLPPNYDPTDADGYAVLYMHDGQNLFESKKSYIGVDWDMDESMAALGRTREIVPTLVVAVWNTPLRLREYLPQRPYEEHVSRRSLIRTLKHYGGTPLSDAYLRFLVHELKPFVDRRYRTRPEREFTCVMGSSMGGLISLYAICEYPQVFGGAGCLSTHWPFVHRPFHAYLKTRLPEPGQHRIYLDYGNEIESPGYRFSQMQVEQILTKGGYRYGRDWFRRWYYGHPHSETAWRARVRFPLRFLLQRERRRSGATADPKGGAHVF